MWNDTDTPLAYLITFRTYGTWLHGDERGSFDRHNNVYGQPGIARNDTWKRIETKLQHRELVLLDAKRRASVEKAIGDNCSIRGWDLLAVNVRTNHVHTVIAASKSPELILNALKANATRQMREDGCWRSDSTPWAAKGSTRYLWNEKSVATAVDYVVNGQGDNLPSFE